MGVFTGGYIIGSFIFGKSPSIAAVIMNYVRRDEAAVPGSRPLQLQLRTFWFAALAFPADPPVSAPLVLLLGLGIITWMLGAFVVGVGSSTDGGGLLRLKTAGPSDTETTMQIAQDKVVLIHYSSRRRREGAR